MAETPLERRLPRQGWITAAVAATRPAWRWEVALIIIVLVATAVRVNGLDWDQPDGAQAPLQMHPDERFLSIVSSGADWPDSVGGYFDTDSSPLNPYNVRDINAYVYGTYPLFLVKGTATLADKGVFTPLTWIGMEVPDGDPPGVENSYDQTATWGRAITSFVDTVTVLLVFAAGSVLFNRGVGLLAAAAYALAVLPTQLAHFFTMDPYVTSSATALLLCSALAVTSEGVAKRAVVAAALGLSMGLLLGSKVSAAPLLVLPVAAIAIRILLRDVRGANFRWQGNTHRPRGYWANDVSFLCLSLLAGAMVFRVVQPYAFQAPDFGDSPLDWPEGVVSLFELNQEWEADLQRERDFQDGEVDYPPFVQFAGTTPFLTGLKNMSIWGMGPALGSLSLAAAAWASIQVVRRRELAVVLPILTIAAIYGFFGMRFVAFMRYFEPTYPAFFILAAWAAIEAGRWLRRAEPGRPLLPDQWREKLGGAGQSLRVVHLRWATVAAGVAVVVGTLLWALAFQNVYAETHTRIQASEWLYEHAPPGSGITGEIWDDTIPYFLPGDRTPVDYQIIGLDMYQPDSVDKVRSLIYGAPGTEGGGLVNAEYVAITSHRVKDSVAKLQAEYPATLRYYELLESGELGFEQVAHFEVRPSLFGFRIDDSGAEESFTVYDHPEVTIYQKTDAFDPGRAFALLMEAHPERAVNLLPGQGATNGLLLIPGELEAQQGGGTFSDVFDGGAWTSKPAWLWWFLVLEVLSLAMVPAAGWLFRALPDRGYGLTKLFGLAVPGLTTWIAIAWLGIDFSRTLATACSLLLVAGGVAIAAARWRSLVADFRANWRAWAALEALFVIAFFAFLLLRAFNPDVWHHPQGGEKPMEMAYLTAVIRSTKMPPFDPWFGGGVMNYYYMGWFLLAVPARILQTLPEVTFNLGVATYAAVSASVAASTVYNLTGLSLGSPFAVKRVIRWRDVVAPMALGAVLLVALGNLDGGHQLIERVQRLSTWGLLDGVPVAGGAIDIVGGVYQWLFNGGELAPFDWWRSSRVHIGQFDITEFPYWTFLFADLHPHMMGLPFFGLTIAIGLAYAATARAGLRLQAFALAVAMGIALGFVRTVHTWDFPAAVAIAIGGVAIGQWLATGRVRDRFGWGLLHLAIAAAVLTVLFAPYTSRFEVFNAGLQRAPETTEFNQYLAHFGLFVALAVIYLVVRYWEELRHRDREAERNPALVVVLGWWEVFSLTAFLAGLAALTWQFGLTTIAISLVLEFFLLNLLWLELRAPERDLGRIVATSMFALGFAIAAGVDVVTVKNDIVRMNTVFKFSLQAWQLFAAAGAFALWYVTRALWQLDHWRVTPQAGRGLAAAGATIVVGTLVIGSSIFMFEGTEARQQQRFGDTGLTLDGLAFFEHGTYTEDLGTQDPADDVEIDLADDLPLVEWLRENVEGSPVVAEAVGPLYHWTGRMSMLTGNPSVIGWDWHQMQQRWDYQGWINERRADTQRFFQSTDSAEAERYLRKYNVRYVVIGTEEHAWGTPEGLETIANLPTLDEVFRSGRYAIYEVDQSRLPAPQP